MSNSLNVYPKCEQFIVNHTSVKPLKKKKVLSLIELRPTAIGRPGKNGTFAMRHFQTSLSVGSVGLSPRMIQFSCSRCFILLPGGYESGCQHSRNQAGEGARRPLHSAGRLLFHPCLQATSYLTFCSACCPQSDTALTSVNISLEYILYT